MLIYDDTYHWKGWGGRLRLGSGKCHLKIYDLKKSAKESLTHLRPIVVIVTDIPGSKMSVRSCAGHIATCVVKDFNIDKNRMLWIEYYPHKTYGAGKVHHMPESYEAVEFTWHDGNAIKPRWRALNPPMRDTIKNLLSN